jgi:hypothetical protein
MSRHYLPADVMRSATPQLRVVARNDSPLQPELRPCEQQRHLGKVIPALAALAGVAILPVALMVVVLLWLCGFAAAAAWMLVGDIARGAAAARSALRTAIRPPWPGRGA